MGIWPSLLDGTKEAAERLKMMLSWDILNGVCDRILQNT